MVRRNKKLFITLVVVGTLMIGGVGYFIYSNHSQEAKEAQKSNVDGQIDRENRKETPNSNPQNNNQAQSKKQANPVLARWGAQDGAIEVAGFVQGIYEDGGTCTYKLSQGSSVVTRTTTGTRDATTTSCPPAQISTSELGGGTWGIELTYESATAVGTSSKQELSL